MIVAAGFILASAVPSSNSPYLHFSSCTMSTSVATTDTNTSPSKSKQRRGGGGGSRGSRGRRGGGPTQRKPQRDPASAESTAAADTPATPTTPTPDVVNPNTAVENTDTAPPDDDGVCWICAEPVKYYSVSECNHRTCHVCALRLRALWKRQDCTFCKVTSSSCMRKQTRIHMILSLHRNLNPP